jgi:ABC-type branched-subunit amino acid transport system substrate-binding protein
MFTVRNVFVLLLLAAFSLFGCAMSETNMPWKQTAVSRPAENPNYSGSQTQSPPEQLPESRSGFFGAPASTIPPTKIALLLPLTGQYKDLGKNMLDAAQLALFSIGDPNLVLLPFDTKDTMFGAVEAANLAIAAEVKLILGPVFGKSAVSIASLAKAHQIPVVSFSNDKNLAGSGAYAIGFSPEQQIRRITEYALEQGIEDFTTVLPNDAYGAIALQEMRESVMQNKNASVLKTQVFRLDDNGEPLMLKEAVFTAFDAAVNTKPTKYYDKVKKAYNDLPIKYPRALLIPEGGKQLDQIATLLAENKNDPKIVQLLGSGQWSLTDIQKHPNLEGAWIAGPPQDRRENFERNFEQTYGYKPINIAGLAYDGIALAITLAKSTPDGQFSRTALEDPKGFIGVDGIFRFRSDGLTERGLAVMQVKNGQFDVIVPAPTDFVNFKDTIREKKKGSGDRD